MLTARPGPVYAFLKAYVQDRSLFGNVTFAPFVENKAFKSAVPQITTRFRCCNQYMMYSVTQVCGTVSADICLSVCFRCNKLIYSNTSINVTLFFLQLHSQGHIVLFKKMFLVSLILLLYYSLSTPAENIVNFILVYLLDGFSRLTFRLRF